MWQHLSYPNLSHHRPQVEWSALALDALFTRAVSSSSLLVMLGCRGKYVVAIISWNGGDIFCVTCMRDERVVHFFMKIYVQAQFWVACSGPRPPDPYTIGKLVKRRICNILRKSRCKGCGKSYGRSTKIDENRFFLLQKGVRQYYS